MASLRRDIVTRAGSSEVWAAVRDVGALHTRLVPGFVTNTRLDGNVRIVTFGNGTVLREPIITIDDAAMRVVWSVEGGLTTHYNASAQVMAEPDGGSRVVWMADFLPDDAAAALNAAMAAGAEAMKQTLGRLAGA